VKQLVVTAEMAAPVEWRFPVMLDGLLASVVAGNSGFRPPRCVAECISIVIPIALEQDGRFHLASEAHCSSMLLCRTEHIHKRPPVEELAFLGPASHKSVNIKAGVDKAWRVPRPGELYRTLTWWCVGHEDGIRLLLHHITAIGSRRRHGVGRVRKWTVNSCEAWPGFPCLRDGIPMRPLPLDWPGVDPGSRKAVRSVTFPYFLRERQDLLWAPPG
jgi:hypothetical protein